MPLPGAARRPDSPARGAARDEQPAIRAGQ